ncbi:pregnancy-specific glycoprotein 22-like [Mantella aurantiaca]
MLGIWKSLVQTLVLAVTFSACMNSASGIKIEVSPPHPKVGENVILKVTEIPGNIRFATWYKGQSTDAPNQILNFFPPSTQYKGDKYFAGAQGLVNGSLEIQNIQTEANGYYTVQIQTTESLQQNFVSLTVSGVISLALSPLAVLLGMLLLSELNFL